MLKLWEGEERENEPWETIIPVFLARGKWDKWSNICHDCEGDRTYTEAVNFPLTITILHTDLQSWETIGIVGIY